MKASIRKAVTPSRRSAPRGNERRLVTRHPRRRILSLVASAAAMPGLSQISWAQAYPTRPVRIIVGFAAGGGTDIMARLRTEAAVRAPADGHTMLVVTATNTINTTFYEKLRFDLIRDIAPVAGIARALLVMMVNPSGPGQDRPPVHNLRPS